MKFYIYNVHRANGAKVIVNNLIDAFRRINIDVEEISSLANCTPNDYIIAYGVKECHKVASFNFKYRFALLVDAISLGYRNKIIFYLKQHHFLNFDFFYSIYGYIRYSKMEKDVVNEYNDVMLVSNVDINYLQNKIPNSTCKFHCVANGANFVNNFNFKITKNDKIRLGILSSWISRQSAEETNWFIQKWYRKYTVEHNDVELIIAGRGNYLNKYKRLKNVIVLGEVDSLEVFFSSIDAFLTLSPKGCGILNRVLDAMAYKVPVAGISSSFSGFPNSEDVFVRFDSYISFCKIVNKLKDPNYRRTLSNNVYLYAKENNCWNNNYDVFAKTIVNSF